jgi:hypothetical protein
MKLGAFARAARNPGRVTKSIFGGRDGALRRPGQAFPRAEAAARRPFLPSLNAFTLMEVMIAIGIFFMASFAILAMVSTTLRNARGLRETRPDIGMVAAQISLTNRLFEGSDSGDFSELGDLYSGYGWASADNEVESNGLHQVDFVVRQRHGDVETHISIFLFRPESPPGAASGGGFGGLGGGFPR